MKYWILGIALTLLVAVVTGACGNDNIPDGATGTNDMTVVEQPFDPPAPEEPAGEANSLEELLFQVKQRTHDIRGLGIPETSLSKEFEGVVPTTIGGLRYTSSKAQVYKLLGVLDNDADYSELIADLYSAGVAGIYPDGQVQVGNSPDTNLSLPALRAYISQYINYLQEFVLNVEETPDELVSTYIRRGGDDTLAHLALMQGDAILAGERVLSEYSSDYAHLGGDTTELAPEASEIVKWLGINNPILAMLTVPYDAGVQFVGQVLENAADDYEAVNELYSNLPVSTEQILHPDLYPDHLPVDISDRLIPDVPGNWNRRFDVRGAQGELFIRSWLTTLGSSSDLAETAAEGWGNDNLSLFRRTDDGTNDTFGLNWRIVWDNPETDALELARALRNAIPRNSTAPSPIVGGVDIKGNSCGAASNISWVTDSGVLVHQVQDHPDYGAVTVIAVAPDCETALELLPIYDPVFSQSELDALLRQVEVRTRELRGLEAPAEPIYTLVPIEGFNEDVAEAYIYTYRDSHRETVYKLLGTLNADVDIVSLLVPTVTRVRGGNYDGKRIRISYEDDNDDPFVLDRFFTTYAHEYTHYLQDRHFDIFHSILSFELNFFSMDRYDTSRALVEGEATLVGALYYNKYRENYAPTQETPTLASRVTTSFDDPLRGFLLNFAFSYEYGANFVARFVPELEAYDFPTIISSITDTRFISDDALSRNVDQARSVPQSETYDFTAVDALYSNPPVSSEQILHPELYPDHTPIEIPEGLLSIPGGWNLTDTTSNPLLHGAYGEFFIRAWLETLKVDVELAYNAAAGWGNDHFTLLQSDDDELAILWTIIWDDPETDSAELADALTDTITKQHDVTASTVVRDPTIESNTCGVDSNISWKADTGVLVHQIQTDPTVGDVTKIAIAASCEAALELLDESN